MAGAWPAPAPADIEFSNAAPTPDFTGSWYNAGDPGWGLTLVTRGDAPGGSWLRTDSEIQLLSDPSD